MDNEFEQKRRFLADIPDVYRNIFEVAFAGTSLRKAINAKCLDCTSLQKNEVKACQIVTCPLWTVRPYQEKANLAEKPIVTGGFSEKQQELALNY